MGVRSSEQTCAFIPCLSLVSVYTYIQSRFYRAPDIILGIPYTPAIDMWSLACILVELFTGRGSLHIDHHLLTCTMSLLQGYPLFPGENEQEQLSLIIEVIGLPPSSVLEQGTRRKLFFGSSSLHFVRRVDASTLFYANSDSRGLPRHVRNKSSDIRRPASRSLAKMLPTTDNDFLDFIQRCFEFVAVTVDRLVSTFVSLTCSDGIPSSVSVQTKDFNILG